MGLSLAQLKMRRSGITATDISAILGENPWHKPIDVWMDKMGYTPLEKPGGERADMGNAFESAVAQYYKRTQCPTGKHWRIYKPTVTIRSKQCEWALATPDRYVFENDAGVSFISASGLDAMSGKAHHLLEVKLVGPRAMDKWLLRNDEPEVECDADRLPTYVYCQVQWQMFVTEHYKRCDVAAQLGGTSFRVFNIDRDDAFLDHAVKTAERFWARNVVGKATPEPDGSESYKGFLNQTFPDAKVVDLVPAPAEAEQIARSYKDACALKAEADEDRETCSQQLKTIIGSGAGIEGSWGKATWLTSRGQVDYKKLCEALKVPQGTIEKYRGTNRVLRVTMKGEK
ncbi:MAG: YqaJ viral recombinase family protein [bacterium]